MVTFQGEAEAAGAMVVLRTPVLSGRVRDDGFDLDIGGDKPIAIRCRRLVNSAGLYAPALARAIAPARASNSGPDRPRKWLARRSPPE